MPAFTLSTAVDAPLEEVWKLLYDPSRFPEWWYGMESVEPGEQAGDFTYWITGYPDFPMPQKLQAHQGDRRVTISCLVSLLELVWQLEELDGDRTMVGLDVTIPEQEAHRLDDQRDYAERSLTRLADLAAQGDQASR
ncbi:SRPBCC family protein [Angustibacter sp. McL0619]|uniref:SRPBCC family protein n=1 Tax=Angustibacter sp. McL0619 TaxID=3415676 RepID=UPI003CF09EDF